MDSGKRLPLIKKPSNFFPPYLRIDAKVEKFKVTGTPQKDYLPKLVNSVAMSDEDEEPLLSFSFETNPLNEEYDDKIHALSRPLEFIYDAVRL